MKENSEQIVNKILEDTLNDVLKWEIGFDTRVYISYVTKIKITENKQLTIIYYYYYDSLNLSSIEIVYNIKKETFSEKIKIRDIKYHFAFKSIKDLLDVLNKKFKKHTNG